MTVNGKESPNPQLDRIIKGLLRKARREPPDTAVKIVAQAISWEKVKYHISDKEDEFNPDNL